MYEQLTRTDRTDLDNGTNTLDLDSPRTRRLHLFFEFDIIYYSIA